MPRRPFRSRMPDSMRRKTFWVGSADSTDTQSLAAGASVLDQSLQISIGLPSTLVRTRGSIWVGSDQVASAEFPFGALGMAVVQTPAFNAGITALDTPITEEGSDNFFLHQFFGASIRLASAVGIQSPALERYDFDSKAQRKFTEDETIVVTLENASATDGLVYIVKFRMLFKAA